jgi:hypothetical protein
MQGGEGVLVGAFQSEREEETRDRAERGSAVRGSDQASVAPKRTPSPTTYRDANRSAYTLSMMFRLYNTSRIPYHNSTKLKAKAKDATRGGSHEAYAI